METLEQCPLCQSKTLTGFLKVKDFSVSGEIFNISQCKDCGLRFTNPRPGPEEIGQYYKFTDYVSHTDEEATGFINQLYRRVRRITLKQKEGWINSLIPNQGTLMDIGCGTGDFAGHMQSKGWKVEAVEPDESAATKARAKHGLKVFPEEYLQSTTQAYDAVTLWHVLEHVHPLDERIRQFTSLVKKGGYLFIALPNAEAKDAAHYREFWAAWDVPRHLYHFRGKVLRNRIEQAGFACVSEKSLPFDPFYIAMLSEKYRSGKDRALLGLWKGFGFWWKTFKDERGSSSKLYVFLKG
ncbi:MAG: class I SAM-dependent methyltransferase [Sphingomonadales bacterium]|nr:class I SAM-dependent methyltransferase [Sphingomonadales bacterium]